MIYPEAVWPEAIIWTKYHSKLGYSLVNFDEKCPYLSASANKIHVWDTPQEALGITDPTIYPDIELYYNDKAGIDLADLLGIHYIKDTKIHSAKPGTLKFKDADFMRFGLTYKFELIDYSIDGNSTHDSKYCTLSEDGIIIAKNVKADGVTIDDQSATSVGREPLVRVLVSRGDRTILDGYILVHITEKAPEPEDLLVDNYPAQDYTWDLCGDKTVFTTNWSQFSYYVLTEKMDNLEKDNFDLLYGNSYNASGDLLNGVPDLLYPAVKDVDYFAIDEKTYRYDNVMVFNDNNGKPGSQCKTRDLPGQVRYFHNFDGTTNHRFEWVITGNELEEYTHDNGGKYLTTPRTITKWFRYTRTTGQAAKYEHVYVKMTLNLKRATIANVPVKEKIDNYWFNYQGSDTGWDAIIWNPWFPQDFGTIHEYVQYIPTTFRYNKVNFQNTTVPYKDDATDATRNSKAKYYFTPYEFQIQAQDGTWYTITARSGKNDQKWDAFVCKYLRWENDGTPSYNHIKKDGTYHNLHWYSASNDKTYTEHKWAYTLKKEKNVDGIECERWYTNADANKNTHKWCAIYTGKFNGVGDPELDALGIGGGVYDNKTLYAVQSAKGNIHGGSYATATNYTPIAELNQNITSGEMKLVWRTPDNDITKEVLNAVGYFKQEGTMDDPDFVAHWNVKEELNSMVGIIAHNGCYVALDIDEEVDGNDNTKAGTFYTSWQRPINVVEKDKEFYDATTNGEYHLAVDFIKIFDWRGPVKGYMWDDAQWLWAYNNIKSVIIDTYPGRVYTNMHQTNVNTFVPLNSITTEARLYTVYNVQADGVTPATSKHDAKYARTTSNVFDAANYINIPVLTGGTTDWPLKGFDEQAKNDDLLREMGLKPVNEVKKLQFLGGIYYENNGDNVTDFDVKVPVWINYEWGRFCTNVMIHIHRSLGN
jgi:hypothetical protein